MRPATDRNADNVVGHIETGFRKRYLCSIKGHELGFVCKSPGRYLEAAAHLGADRVSFPVEIREVRPGERIQAQEAVKENEARLQELLDSSPIGADIVRPVAAH